jgi:SAM-dependent methyltransferase
MNYKAVAADRLESSAADIIRLEPSMDYYVPYWEQQAPRLRNDLKRLLQVATPRSKVLDVGVSPPIMLSTLTKLGFDAVGVDINPSSFQRTIDELKLRVEKTDIERELLPFASGHFDLVYFAEVFEHLRIDPIFTAKELHRVLAPGGTLILTTPNLHSLAGMYSFFFKGLAYSCANDGVFDQFDMIHRQGYFGHIREYTHQEMKSFLTKIGFRDVQVEFWGGGAKPWTRPIYWMAPSLRYSMVLIAKK